MRTALLLTLTLGLLAAGCERENRPADSVHSRLDATTFAHVLGELAVARVELFPDTSAYRERRDEILGRAGIGPEEVSGFVAAHGGDEDMMIEIYRQVADRLDTLAQR